MPIIIATSSPAFGTAPEAAHKIEEHGWKVVSLLTPGLNGPELMQDTIRRMDEFAENMDVLSVGLAPVSAKFIRKAPKLKALVKFGVGVDNIDIKAATEKGIPVINAPRGNSNAVVELAIGFMLDLSRHISLMHNNIMSGGWTRFVGHEIEGKVLGIVGLGSIGKILARKAQALGMTVIATDPYPDLQFAAQQGIPMLSLHELLAQADFVSLHSVGGAQNRNMMDAPEFALMKKSAYLMNLSRGEIVNTDALTEALKNGSIAGAALDAFAVEPPNRKDEIFSLPNVLCTTHIGGHTHEAQANVNAMNIEDIALVLSGKRPVHVVNSEIYQ